MSVLPVKRLCQGGLEVVQQYTDSPGTHAWGGDRDRDATRVQQGVQQDVQGCMCIWSMTCVRLQQPPSAAAALSHVPGYRSACVTIVGGEWRLPHAMCVQAALTGMPWAQPCVCKHHTLVWWCGGCSRLVLRPGSTVARPAGMVVGRRPPADWVQRRNVHPLSGESGTCTWAHCAWHQAEPLLAACTMPAGALLRLSSTTGVQLQLMRLITGIFLGCLQQWAV